MHRRICPQSVKLNSMKKSYFIKHLSGTAFFILILFVSAGRFNYWQGLVYMFIGMVMFTLNYTLLRIDPQLSEERSKPAEGSKKWDKRLLLFSLLVTIVMYVVAGLDSGRYHWSPQFPPALYAAGIVLIIAGQLVFLVAQKQNRFFSSTMHIQKERGHAVYESGLYSIIRHPGYLGLIMQTAGFPLLFGSVWCLIPATVSLLLIITRTWLEDQTLKNELKGYVEYVEKTRCILIPFIW